MERLAREGARGRAQSKRTMVRMHQYQFVAAAASPETDHLASSEILSIKHPISKLAPSKTHSILLSADRTGLATCPMKPFWHLSDLEGQLKSPSWPPAPDLLGMTGHLTGRQDVARKVTIA